MLIRYSRATLPMVLCLTVLGAAFAEIGSAQLVAGGDFDICDNMGTLSGKTARLRGRAGFGTTQGIFVISNAATVEQDCGMDGYTPGVDFRNLAVTDTSNFINAADPTRVILRDNFVLSSFLNPLLNGFVRQVFFLVNIPEGTPAGFYRGTVQVTDTVLRPGLNPAGNTLRLDLFFIEIEVLPESGVGLVRADTAARLDSLVLRGRAGQTVSDVVRLANVGNVELQNVRLEATDLVATSGTGLRIRRDRISFSPAQLQNIAFGDTARIVVTVRIPTGLLAGEYRGDLIAQATGVEEFRVPLIVIVTTPGDIVFEDNPVRARVGDNAVIIFNADPGTQWQMRIFDMRAITTFAAEGTVFPGVAAGTNGSGVGDIPGDQAVRYTWPLVNGRGEAVAGGMYYVVIIAEQNGVRRQLRGRLMVIR